MLGLAAMSLWMIRSLSRASLPPLPSTPNLPGLPTSEKEEEEAQKGPRFARFAAGGPSLKDELADLVREDPEAAANILRAWIGTPQ